MSSPPAFVVTAATVLGPDGTARRCDVDVAAAGIRSVRPSGQGPRDLPSLEGRGRLLVPAFRDAHCHLVFAGLLATRPNLGAAASKAEVLERLARALAVHEGEGALVAEGWDDSEWRDGAPLAREDLDRLSGEVPIVARRSCAHVAVVNGVALAHLPRGPDVDAASGRLRHEAAMRVEAYLPGLAEERRRALAAAVDLAREGGLVEVTDFCTLADLDELRVAAAEGRLPLRMRGWLRYEEWAALSPQVRERTLDPGGAVPVVGLKLFADGTIGSESAAIGEPYAAGGRGDLMLDADRIEAAARAAHAAGLPVAVHAIGDRAVSAVLDGLARAGVAGDRIEHAELIAPADVARMADLGVIASMQPNFVARFAGPGGLYARRLGGARARSTNRFGTLVRAGVEVLFGSDGMPIGPALGFEGALGHPDPSERLAPNQALAAYASSPRGVVPGAPADLLLLSVEDPAALAGARVDAAWSGGVPVPLPRERRAERC